MKRVSDHGGFGSHGCREGMGFVGEGGGSARRIKIPDTI